ncbi:MAG: LamG domain-containing protein [Myxococcales bacterium]|nr:LamG domain-containing protein [Myxococcales bacterium]
MKNGKETDVDCGGGTCATCSDGKGCAAAADCGSGSCVGNLCKGTVLLLHMDGVNNAKVFPDSSPSKHVITVGGDAKVSTADSKFGGASGYFDGNGDFLGVADSPDWNLGTGDFTIDYWMRSANNVQNARMHALSFGNANGTNIDFDYNDKDQGGWGFWIYWNGGGGNLVRVNTVYTDNKWHHVALVRAGTLFTGYVDGKSIGSMNYAPALNVSGNFNRYIGLGATGSWPYLGYLDELRILKGVARWTMNFTPPDAAY